MAGDRRSKNLYEPDGGEAEPRPLKAFRLLDEMEPAPSVEPRGRSKNYSREGRQSDRSPVEARSSAVRRPIGTQDRLQSPREEAPKEGLLPSDGGSTGYAVLSVTPTGEGEAVAVVLAQPNPEGGKPLRVKLYLLTEQYADLGVKAGAIAPEEAEALLEAGNLCAAIRRGMGLLQYGSPSTRRLAYKLAAKGIQRELAEAAAAYLADKGYIREEDTATLRAEQGLRKGWGKRRIHEDLRAHGFAEEAVREALDALSDTDWIENCVAVIRKKYGPVPEDRAARQKMTAALLRLGYDADTVRNAMRHILRGN